MIGLAVTVAAAVAAVAWRIADPVPVVENTLGFGDLSLVSFGVLGITFAAVGGLLVVRRPPNAVGWVMVVIGLCNALSALAAAITFSAVAGRTGGRRYRIGRCLVVASCSRRSAVSCSALGVIFPTGRGQTPAWDRSIRVAAVAPAGLSSLSVSSSDPVRSRSSRHRQSVRVRARPPAHLRSAAFGRDGGSVVWLAPIVVWSIASRYRMSGTVERQQLKWFVASLLVSIGGFAFAVIAAAFTDRPPESAWPCSASRARSSRSPSASPSCATACTTSTGSSAGPCRTRSSPACWAQSSSAASCSPDAFRA